MARFLNDLKNFLGAVGAAVTLDDGEGGPPRLGKARLGLHPGRLLEGLGWRWEDGLELSWDRRADLALYGARAAAHVGGEADLSSYLRLPLLGYAGAWLKLPEGLPRWLADRIEAVEMRHDYELGLWAGRYSPEDDYQLRLDWGDPNYGMLSKPWWRSRPLVLSIDPRRWLLGPVRQLDLGHTPTAPTALPLPERAYPCRVVLSRYRRVRARLAALPWAGEAYTVGSVVLLGDAEVDDGSHKGGWGSMSVGRVESAEEALGRCVGNVLASRRRNGWKPSYPRHPRPEWVAVWDAVLRFAQSCGGDTGEGTIGELRMDAVVAVDRALEDLVGQPTDLGEEPARDPERAEWLARQDGKLVERAVRNLAAVAGSAQDAPLWDAAKRLFACGSQVAQALCRRFGLNPDDVLEGLVDEHGTCETCGTTKCPACGELSDQDYCGECSAICEACNECVPKKDAVVGADDEEGATYFCKECVGQIDVAPIDAPHRGSCHGPSGWMCMDCGATTDTEPCPGPPPAACSVPSGKPVLDHSFEDSGPNFPDQCRHDALPETNSAGETKVMRKCGYPRAAHPLTPTKEDPRA